MKAFDLKNANHLVSKQNHIFPRFSSLINMHYEEKPLYVCIEIFLNVLYDMAVVAFELHDKIKRVLVLALI